MEFAKGVVAFAFITEEANFPLAIPTFARVGLRN